MTLTDTVSYLAHDASEVAHDLRRTAIDLGRVAAESGSEVAASAASTAGSLAKAVADRLPDRLTGTPAPPPRSFHWMRWVGLVVVVAVIAVVLKRRRRPMVDPVAVPVAPSETERSNGHVKASSVAGS
jgi:hypothetical protein